MNLCGLHDIEATAIAAPDSWIVDTVALVERPTPKVYPPSLHTIARLNYGYGSTGTLPVPDQYPAFAQRVAQYVNGSSNCRRWIIGNEPNLSREWPDNQPIYPWNYAACYKGCRDAIHALPGHGQDEVLIAASGPWNDELKYNSNKNGDWIIYFSDVIGLCAGRLDGFAIHAYTHGYDPSLVTSTARMDAPFQHHYYEFRTYQDYLRAIPDDLRHKPSYITEANGNGPWQAVGLMPAMLGEIDAWNQSGTQKIHAVIFYRYPRYDTFFIEGRNDVIAEYRAAAARGYESPGHDILPPPTPEPEPPRPTPPPDPEPARDIDPALALRGVHFDFAKVPAGTGYWRIVSATWLDEQEADAVGPDHHILGTIKFEHKQVAGVPLSVTWPSGSDRFVSKPDQSNATYNWDWPMSASLNEFSITVADGAPSDKASGIGMGAGGNPGVHTSTWIEYEWTISEGPDRPPLPPLTPVAGRLLWPVTGPVTQYFGEGEPHFGQKAHNGIDIAVPEGTPVACIADGVVMFTGFDAGGYGNYCRVYHPTIRSHSFYAHLAAVDCNAGEIVKQGEWIGHSGNTGNSTGPHLHFELRAGNKDVYYQGVTIGYTQGRYNPVDAYVVTGSPLMPGAEV